MQGDPDLLLVREDHPTAGAVSYRCPGADRANLLAMIFTPNSASTSRSIGRARASPARASSLSRRWWTGGACTASLIDLIRRHVLAAERLHGDHSTVPVLANVETARYANTFVDAVARIGEMPSSFRVPAIELNSQSDVKST